MAALNREIAALVRAGLPLEEGLQQIAEVEARGPGDIAARLGQATAAGKSLAEAIAAQGESLPPAYRAVVAAGLKAGRLPAALEGFADGAARIADLRRIAAQAAVYPLIVLVLASLLLLAVIAIVLPRYGWLDIGDRIWATPLAVSPVTALLCGTGLTAAVLILAVAWWRRTASGRGASRRSAWVAWIPGARRAAQLCGQASFADMLGVLVACRVPLVEALPLAGQASGLAPLGRSADELAAALAKGQPLTAQLSSARGLPPLVRAALWGSVSQEALETALARAAEVYRDRASAWVAQAAVIVPVAATLAVGIFVVGTCAVLILQPYIAALHEAASWY